MTTANGLPPRRAQWLAAACLLPGIAAVGCDNGNQAAPPPNSGQQSAVSPIDGWVDECPGGAFCFSRPGYLSPQPVQAIDSLAALYRGGGLTLTFDMGRYENSVSGMDGAAEEQTAIDGRPARLLGTGSKMLLVVPKVHESDPVPTHFTMILNFEGKVSRPLAERIFHSIQFKDPH